MHVEGPMLGVRSETPELGVTAIADRYLGKAMVQREVGEARERKNRDRRGNVPERVSHGR